MKQSNRSVLGEHRTARRAWRAICLSALFFAGCGESVQAFTVMGQPAAVTKYKTFGVVIPDPEDLKENQMRPETMQHLAQLSVQRMQSLGYQPVAPKEADLLIGLSPEATLYGPLKVVNETNGTNQHLDEHFDAEGTLNVSFVDMHANQLVFKRVAKARVNSRLGEEQMQEIVASVFEGMPRAPEIGAP
jgi:hypothetical protein